MAPPAPRPRRAGPVWLWVLGLIVLVILIWLVLTRDRGPAVEGVAPAGAVEAPAAPAPKIPPALALEPTSGVY